MKRRAFVKKSALTAGLLATGWPGAAARAHHSPEEGARPPFRAARDLAATRGAPFMLLRFLARSADTGASFALIEGRGRPGMEPPRHVHHREDESIYLIEGSIGFEAGGEEFEVNAGEMIFLPRRMPHGFKILSDEMRVLLLLTPGGLDEWFWRVTAPAASLDEIPGPPAAPPSADEMQQMLELLAEFGVDPA